MLAQRTNLFATSGTATARAAAKAAASNGRTIIDLSAGEIWSELATTIRNAAISAIEQGVNRYTDTIGLEPLRQAIAKKMSFDTGHVWNAEEIAVTAGAKQALFNAAMVVLNPGDEVIIPCPYWTTFPAQVSIAGAKPVFLDTRSSGYVPDIKAIQSAVTPATRAIVVNTPTNPTGAVYDNATLAGIAELAIRHGLWVIFDECYAAFTYDPHLHNHIVSIAPEIRPRTLSINSFSKQLAMTGWRIGYLGAPREVITAVKALQSHTTSNPNVIAQYAVLAHLHLSDGSFERELRHRLGRARARGLAILSELRGVPPPIAEGGFYFYLDLNTFVGKELGGTTIKCADDIANMLLAEAGVAAVSGTAFGDPQGLRLSYGIDLEQLEFGLQRVVDALNGTRKHYAAQV